MIDKVHSLLLFAQEHGEETTEHADEPSGVDLVLPAFEELVWGLIVFGVVLLVLNKVLFPKIRQGIEAREHAEDIVARAQETINAERTRTIQELQGTIAAISIDLAEKVVGRSLDDQTQREFVDAYIRDVAGMGANGGSSN